MNRYTLAPRAVADLNAIWDYIAIQNNSPENAKQFLDRFCEKFTLLASHPLLGESRSDLRPDLRIFAADNYVILYYPLSDGVEIVGVLHGARDYQSLFQKGSR
ncbi:MAG: type II toxin-antitoxin system RelE/ParE family toxin [Thermoguttaceae bacterium]|jgi:toxin ParE1/3/4